MAFSCTSNVVAEMSIHTRRTKPKRMTETYECRRLGKRPRMEDATSKGDGTHKAYTTQKRKNEDPITMGQSSVEEQTVERGVYLTSRCTPSRFSKIVKKFNGEQCAAIESLGLRGLLHVQQLSLTMWLIHVLALRFDLDMQKLRVHGKVIPFNEEEVSRILGIANSGLKAPADCSREEEAEIRAQYNLVDGEIKVGDLECNLHELSGDEFKAKFILYAIGTLLNPPTGVRVSLKHLAVLRNLEECSKINWARFTFEGLVDGVRQLKETKTKNTTNKYITGCVLLLQMWYLERLFVVGSVSTPLKMREVPRVKEWSGKAISKLLETVSRISIDIDDDKIHMLEDELVGEKLDEGDSHNVRKTMGVILRQQENLLARQDVMDSKLTSLREELLGSIDAHFDRLRVDLTNALEEKIGKFYEDLRGRRASTPDTGNYFNQTMHDDDVHGEAGETHHPTDRELQLTKPSFYENLASLDISTGGLIPITTGETTKAAGGELFRDDDVGRPPQIPLAKVVTEEAGPSRGIRMSLRPSTARNKAPTNVTGQASVGSSVAFVKSTRTLKRTGIREPHEIKKAPTLRSPYDQPLTRAAKAGRKRVGQPKRLKDGVGPTEDAGLDTAIAAVADADISQIYDYVFEKKPDGGDEEAIVDTHSGVLTRRNIKDAFRPRGWMTSIMIDAVSDLMIQSEMNSAEGRKNWYIPCRFTLCCKPIEDNPIDMYTLACIRDNWFVNPTILPDRIYVPMNEHQQHWYLLLLDIHRRAAYVLDSMPEKDDNKRRRDDVELLLQKFDEMFEDASLDFVRREFGGSFKYFGVCNLDCQRQSNTWDCGVHVMQFMRQVWTDIDSLSRTSIDNDIRRELLHWMVCHPHNNPDIRMHVLTHSSSLRTTKKKLRGTNKAPKKDRVSTAAAASTSHVVETSGYRALHPAIEKRIQRRERYQFSMHDLVGK